MTQNYQKICSAKTADKIWELLHKSNLERVEKLSAEDLVQIHPNGAVFVADISMEELQKIFEVMHILEGTCARLAAEQLTNADLEVKTKDHKPYH